MHKLYLVAAATNKKVRTEEVRLKLEGDQIIAPVMELDLEKDEAVLILEEIIEHIKSAKSNEDLWFNNRGFKKRNYKIQKKPVDIETKQQITMGDCTKVIEVPE